MAWLQGQAGNQNRLVNFKALLHHQVTECRGRKTSLRGKKDISSFFESYWRSNIRTSNGLEDEREDNYKPWRMGPSVGEIGREKPVVSGPRFTDHSLMITRKKPSLLKNVCVCVSSPITCDDALRQAEQTSAGGPQIISCK